MKRYFPILILIFIWMTFGIPSVYACSGEVGVTPDMSVLLNRDVLIRGIVVENSGGNSIIRVERYLKGSGNEYILVHQQSPSLYTNKHIRGYDYGCNYSPQPIALVGAQAYFSLNHELNGTYSAERDGIYRVIPIHNDENGRYVEYVRFDGENYSNANYDPDLVEFIHVTGAEFEAAFAEIYGQVSTLPDTISEFENPYPRFRELFVTTESGQQYLMPIDNESLMPIDRDDMECGENCPIVSPDGGHFAIPHPTENNLYALWYTNRIGGSSLFEDWMLADRIFSPTQIQAQSILFSPDGEYVLTWYENTFSVYAYNFTEFGTIYGLLPTASLIWQYQLNTNDIIPPDAIAGKGTWSADSNAIAFWDSEGLKWIDLRRMSEPRVILERERVFARTSSTQNNSLPSILELSTTGQFIRYGNYDEWALHDILTGQTYDKSIISPDETNIVTFLPETEMEIYPETIDDCYAPLLNCFTSLPVPDNHFIKEVHWQFNQFLFVMTCHESIINNCYTYTTNLEANLSTYRHDVFGMIPAPEAVPTYNTTDFAYDNIYNKYMWVVDDYILNGIDYSSTLDSPIVSVEWGEPLWYLAN